MATQREDTDRPATFYIPNNFVDSGTLMGGMLKVRNVFEAVVIAVFWGFFWTRFPMSFKAVLVLWIVTAVPLGVLALIGVNGGPLSQFVCDFVRYYKRPREYELQGALSVGTIAELQDTAPVQNQEKGGTRNE